MSGSGNGISDFVVFNDSHLGISIGVGVVTLRGYDDGRLYYLLLCRTTSHAGIHKYTHASISDLKRKL